MNEIPHQSGGYNVRYSLGDGSLIVFHIWDGTASASPSWTASALNHENILLLFSIYRSYVGDTRYYKKALNRGVYKYLV